MFVQPERMWISLVFLKKKYETRFKGIQCDLSDDDQLKKLAEESNKYYGSTNILINNAGITKDSIFLRMKDNEWNDVINIKFKFKL